jgi:hypothetical protein
LKNGEINISNYGFRFVLHSKSQWHSSKTWFYWDRAIRIRIFE